MRKSGLGQQALIALAVIAGVAILLAIGFISTQPDASLVSPTSTPEQPAQPSPDTPDFTATFTPTSALLAVQSATPTTAPLLVATATPNVVAQQPTATRKPCGPPSGWTTYTVRAGENLFRIGLRYGQRVDAMLAANCLANDQIKAGQTLYVPPVTPLPSTPTAIPPITPSPHPDETPIIVSNCGDPGAQVTAPTSGATVSDVIFFYGTANIDEFVFYKLEIRPAGGIEEDFVTFDGDEVPVSSGYLGQVAAYAFPAGAYEVRLGVVNMSNAVVAECSLSLTLQGG